MKEPFVFPVHLEPYRQFIHSTGGNSVERLMNLPLSAPKTNAVLHILAVGVAAQVDLLARLHKDGRLTPPDEPAQSF